MITIELTADELKLVRHGLMLAILVEANIGKGKAVTALIRRLEELAP